MRPAATTWTKGAGVERIERSDWRTETPRLGHFELAVYEINSLEGWFLSCVDSRQGASIPKARNWATPTQQATHTTRRYLAGETNVAHVARRSQQLGDGTTELRFRQRVEPRPTLTTAMLVTRFKVSPLCICQYIFFFGQSRCALVSRGGMIGA